MSTATEPTTDPRAEYIAGLRMLADLLDANPHLKLPYDGTVGEMSVLVTSSKTPREDLAAWARVLPGEKRKEPAGVNGEYLMLHGRLRGLLFKVHAKRDDVCERIVLGTEEVTEEVPDPVLLAEIPLVPVTRTKEIVEWRCTSILADAEPVAA